MRIVLDMQGAQTESRFRGIGRYTLSLAKAIVRNKGEHEIYLVLNGLLAHTIEHIRGAFYGLLPQENIRVWHAPGPLRESCPDNTYRRNVAELIREALISSLKPDVIHISSFFEGYVDDAVTSIRSFDETTPVSVSLFDLIPLLNQKTYLKDNPVYENFYLRKISHLRRASVLLSISEYSRQEGLANLNIPGVSIVNVSTGCDRCFRPLQINEDLAHTLLERFGISRQFILSTGGADQRKNLPRLIQAYANIPFDLRSMYQLVLAGKMTESETHRLIQHAKHVKLNADELCFTGYVSDEELVHLYNLCRLYVFPSWHEGFGIPALEAMSCGAAVIGANTSSLPEVIGYPSALFDPHSCVSITKSMCRALTDDCFRQALVQNARDQAAKFSWDKSAQLAIATFEEINRQHKIASTPTSFSKQRLKLGYVSPLPPERSGISDYSATLLPELKRYYDIEVITSQAQVSDSWIRENCVIRNVQWLRDNNHRLDRVLYHIGNSPYHQHMPPMLEEVPGTVVLHDFFLSGLRAYLEECQLVKNLWVRSLYYSHGYLVVRERYCCDNVSAIKMKYPANLDILQQAKGIIVHSNYSRRLADSWFGKGISNDWHVIPLLRKPGVNIERKITRHILNLKMDDFVVCSFGLIGPTKLNHRLLEAWLHSKLAIDHRCVLVFVGANEGGEYGQSLLKIIKEKGRDTRIQITGWTDARTYINYLATADMAVQLRTLSRGETSAAVLDCMNYGIATIVNANGSSEELPAGATWMLPEDFTDYQLIQAVEKLWKDKEIRMEIGARAHKVIHTVNAPEVCAQRYFEAIEQAYATSSKNVYELVHSISQIEDRYHADKDLIPLADAIARTLPEKNRLRTIYLDLSATCRNDLRTGIERTARALTLALINKPLKGYRIEPVYLSSQGGVWRYRYARSYSLQLLGCPTDALDDEAAIPSCGDIVLGMDLSGDTMVKAAKTGFFERLRHDGVKIYFIVYDLLTIYLPHAFPPDSDKAYTRWLSAVADMDGAICISNTVANDLKKWLKGQKVSGTRPFKISSFHLGADLLHSGPSKGLPSNAKQFLANCDRCMIFLMVGTIEPRKGHLLTLEAFDNLWKNDADVRLLIVGKEGWLNVPEHMRRTIPTIKKRLLNHPEIGKRLFWLDSISDEFLIQIYNVSTCLIAASEGEGFGLPLIEAAQHNLPIIARDIEVFREVAGEYAFYFSGNKPEDLEQAILKWLNLFKEKKHPKSDGMPWSTWQKSSDRLMDILLQSDH